MNRDWDKVRREKRARAPLSRAQWRDRRSPRRIGARPRLPEGWWPGKYEGKTPAQVQAEIDHAPANPFSARPEATGGVL